MSIKFILINGPPAAGKTTLVRKISQDLNLPAIGKDDIKEFIADKMNVRGEEWSRILGASSQFAEYALLDQSLAKNKTIILENAFIYEFAKKEIRKIILKHKAGCLEIYCRIEESERLRRLAGRGDADGGRHSIHVDGLAYISLSAQETAQKYRPLKVGQVIYFDGGDYPGLLQEINEFLAMQQS